MSEISLNRAPEQSLGASAAMAAANHTPAAVSDAALAQACREIRIHGQSRRYTHTRVGVGGRMDTLQCAIVLAKLERFDWEVQQRLALGARYNQRCDAAGIARMVQREDRTSVFAQYTVRVANRAQVQDRVTGLELGADDYIIKPFEPAEVVARIRAESPILKALEDAGRIRIVDARYDTSSGKVSWF